MPYSTRLRPIRTRSFVLATLAALAALAVSALAQDLPRLASENGRASLIVDGKPFLILGAQVDNSSGWAERLAAVWPAAERMRLNTLEVPVYWEQLEPQQGKFDFSVTDAILAQARDHHIHLVLLWFGTFKNGRSHYVPAWVKADTRTYPRMLTRGGAPIDVLSPNAAANLAADRAAFVALMHHLREADPQHTVVMMQVENESGSLGSVRDFSPEAQKQFNAQVPESILKALHKPAGNWTQAFGADADETFAAYSVARYINEIAAAGKRELALPMYVNNWLKSPRAYPIQTIPGDDYPSGGPTINMFPVWKAAAPAIDLIAPDIYVPNSENYQQIMRDFHRPDNPLMVPESLGFEPFPGASGYARPLFLAIGQGALGFANFGLDRVKLDNPDAETIAELEGFRLLGSFDRQLAALAYAGKVQTAVEDNGIAQREVDFGTGADGTRIVISFPPAYDPPASPVSTSSDTSHLREGRALVAQLSPGEYLVAAIDCRVDFLAPVHSDKKMQLLTVEEGRYDNDAWVSTRLWNGDETDYGLNFGGKGSLLRVKVGTY